MRKLLLILISCFLLSATLLAQTRTVTGKVTDESGSPVAGASILTKGSKKGVQSGKDGSFSIAVQGNGAASLIVSFVGYKSSVITVTGDTATIQLQRDVTAQEEVVVVGYQTVKRKDLTGSVSSVNAKQLRDIPLSSAAEALAGRLAGVQVTTTEGAPGADVVIRVRGGGSITQDNNPIYIVDGIQVENALQVLSPQDIQSIDVLKDASTTAIYGARGANGVVLITTKSGRPGRTIVNYNGSFGSRQIFKMADVMSPYDFVVWQYERSKLTSDTSFGRIYGTTWDTLKNYQNVPNINWQDRVFGRKAMYSNHNISVSGGGGGVTYNLSLTANKEDGILLQSAFDRKLVNFKLDHRANDKLRTGITVRYVDQSIDGAGTTNSGTRTTNRLRHSIQYRPFEIAAAPAADEFDEDYYRTSNQMQNPVILTMAEYRQAITKGINLSGYFTYNIIKNLSFKSVIGFDNTATRQDNFWSKVTPTARNFATLPVASIANQNSVTITNSNTLQYTISNFKKHHNFDALLGEETYETRSKSTTVETRYFPADITADKALANMGLGTPPTGSTQPRPTSFETPPSRIISFFGRVNYDYDKKILASFSLRADRSSKFRYENGLLLFPSASVAWRFSKEKFMDGFSSWLSDAKVRLGYGTAGNNRIGDLLYLQLYGVTGEYALNHTILPGFAPSALANETLKWEKTISQNLGFDFSFLKNRINLSADIYYNKGKELLLSVAIPPTTGYTTQIQNVGSTSNRGVELQLNALVLDKKNFTWNSSFNISFNKNRVESLGTLQQQTRSSGWQGSDGADDYLVKVGQPVGLMYGFVTDGFYKVEDFTYNATTGVYTLKPGVPNNTVYGASPGALKWKDINGDGVITVDGDRTVIGNANPKFSGGWNNQFSLRNFDMSIFLNFVVGNDVYNANKIEWTDGAFPSQNTLVDMKDRFTYVNSQGQYITDSAGLAALNTNAKIWSPVRVQRYWLHSWAVEDGSFLRINNLTLGYTLPGSILKKIKISSFRIYATVNNLATFTSYTGYDPEVTTRRGDPLTPGVDFAAYPRAKTWVFGVNVNF